MHPEMWVLITEERSRSEQRWQPWFIRLEINHECMPSDEALLFIARLCLAVPIGYREKVGKYWQFPLDQETAIKQVLKVCVPSLRYQWTAREEPAYPHADAALIRMLRAQKAQLLESRDRLREEKWEAIDRANALAEENRRLKTQHGTVSNDYLKGEVRRLTKELETQCTAYSLLKFVANNLRNGGSSCGPRAVLHLTTDAPVEVIKAAYRALSMIHHPDKGGDVKKMQELNQAYAELVK